MDGRLAELDGWARVVRWVELDGWAQVESWAELDGFRFSDPVGRQRLSMSAEMLPT